MDELLTPEEIAQLIKETGWSLKRVESLNLVSNYKTVAKAQLAKTKNKSRPELREQYQRFMMGFPHSLYPISERCLCSKWNCTWFQAYTEPDYKNFPIGWCKRYEPSPDAGYITAFHLPPCVTWAVDTESLKEDGKGELKINFPRPYGRGIK